MEKLRRAGTTAACVAGLLSLAAAMGIGRFAFTPLLPLMVREGSIDVTGGGWLAAANYAGYFAGALTAARVRLAPQALALASLGATALLTAAMGTFDSQAAWLVLRFAAGVASAWVLVATSVWCLAWLAKQGAADAAGMVYAGVGSGIALAGVVCWIASSQGMKPDAQWLVLAALALLITLFVALAVPRDGASAGDALPAAAPASGASVLPRSLVLSYGTLGFGYILPATFLPVLARAVVDEPAVFGAAWPVFGLAAALSTIVAGKLLANMQRRHVLALCHMLMAAGCALPVLHLSASTVLLASLLVGGTFMVATMAGMQEARARAPQAAAAAMASMTAAFALGQMAGPILSSTLGRASSGAGLSIALLAGALALLASAAWLAFGLAAAPVATDSIARK